MKIMTENLTGAALDWAVAKCEGVEFTYEEFPAHELICVQYSTNWSQGGPIIEREEIGIKRNAPCTKGCEWEALGSITVKGAGYRWACGPTPLIAAMRCYVASKLADIIEVPEGLK